MMNSGGSSGKTKGSHTSSANGQKDNSNASATDFASCPLLVHLDLKGAPPKPDYLATIFPRLKQWGCTGLVIEWEDMLPYTGALRCVRNVEHYTKEEVKCILKSAHNAGLDIIPLVQTFGHLEYVLKYPQFAHLREEPDNHMDLCPLAEDDNSTQEGEEEDATLSLDLSVVGAKKSQAAASMLRDLISQVIQMHKDADVPITHVHIGGDEVFSLGNNPLSAAAIALADGGMHTSLGHDSTGLQQLFLDHICSSVLPVIGEHQLTAMLWHDMLDRCPPQWLQRLQYAKHFDLGSSPCPVEVVVWAYTPDIADSLPADAENTGKNSMWQRFKDAGLPLWGASAFKGAASPDTSFPPVARHLSNHLSWVTRAESTSLQGLVLTGWSRFNHTATLCETLPTGIPSLALNLSVIREIGKDNVGKSNQSYFFAGSSSSSTMIPMGSYRELVKDVHRRIYKELGLVWNHGGIVPLTPSLTQLGDLPWPDSSESEGDLGRQRFPGGCLWRLFGQLESAKMQFQRAQENRKLFCPPYTHRLNPPLWRRIEQHCRSTASLVSSIRDRMITYCSQCLTPGSVSEIIYGKVDILERECLHLADELARWRAFHCPGNFEQPSATIGPVPPSPSGAPATVSSSEPHGESVEYVRASYTRTPTRNSLKDTPPNGAFHFMPGLSLDAVERSFSEAVSKRAREWLQGEGILFDSQKKPSVNCNLVELQKIANFLKVRSCNLESNSSDSSLKSVEATAALFIILPLLNNAPRFSGQADDGTSASEDVRMDCDDAE
eukprot:gb/GECG01010466.1/.p1 GENE.gb/GECG01010466.1/~~gb/GECG01010466.1/.p1  ORF type:complete len:777 (+),score=84.93 gb/GECG01010466.1/:1-2331(+)